jgi:hypothetical protein
MTSVDTDHDAGWSLNAFLDESVLNWQGSGQEQYCTKYRKLNKCHLVLAIL